MHRDVELPDLALLFVDLRLLDLDASDHLWYAKWSWFDRVYLSLLVVDLALFLLDSFLHLDEFRDPFFSLADLESMVSHSRLLEADVVSDLSSSVFCVWNLSLDPLDLRLAVRDAALDLREADRLRVNLPRLFLSFRDLVLHRVELFLFFDDLFLRFADTVVHLEFLRQNLLS